MKKILKSIIYRLPFAGTYFKLRTVKYHSFTLKQYLIFRLFKYGSNIYWPRDTTNLIASPENIKIGINSSIGGGGCYIQGNGKLTIGNYVRVTTNVGIMSGNHDLLNHRIQIKKETVIGDYSWIGMNSVILPGVKLGTRTIVAAGSVVTKSFPEGFCVIGGNPARLIKKIDESHFIPHNNTFEFIGFIPKNKFEAYRRKYLSKKQK